MKRYISMVLSVALVFGIIGFTPVFDEKVQSASSINIGDYVDG